MKAARAGLGQSKENQCAWQRQSAESQGPGLRGLMATAVSSTQSAESLKSSQVKIVTTSSEREGDQCGLWPDKWALRIHHEFER